MSERNPALWQQQRTDHTAENDRALLTTIFNGTEGVATSGSMAVTQRAAGANMSVDVAAGTALVKGDDSATVQGLYHVWNDAAKNVTITASDPTNGRRDIIVARVKDAFYSGVSNTFTIEVITGTPAGSPSDPTVPNNCLPLARVVVGAGVTSITNANITDLRTGLSTYMKPWNSAWGRVGQYTSQSINQNPGTGALADVTGASITFTAVAGRLYRATYQTSNYDSGGVGLMRHVLTDSSNNILVSARNRATTANTEQVCTLVSPTFSPSAGSYTVKARAQAIVTTTNGFVYAAADTWLVLTVDDVGPA